MLNYQWDISWENHVDMEIQCDTPSRICVFGCQGRPPDPKQQFGENDDSVANGFFGVPCFHSDNPILVPPAQLSSFVTSLATGVMVNIS